MRSRSCFARDQVLKKLPFHIYQCTVVRVAAWPVSNSIQQQVVCTKREKGQVAKSQRPLSAAWLDIFCALQTQRSISSVQGSKPALLEFTLANIVCNPANASRTRSLWFIKRDPLFNEPRHEVGVHQQQLKDHQKNSMQILPASQKSVEMTLCLEVPFRHRKCRHGKFWTFPIFFLAFIQIRETFWRFWGGLITLWKMTENASQLVFNGILPLI